MSIISESIVPPAEKPEMSTQEASWHEHLAGQRATEAAKDQGGNPAAVEALAEAAGGVEVVSGQPLKPCTQGTILALQKSGEFFTKIEKSEKLDEDEAELLQTGIAAIIFRDPLRAYRELKANGLKNLYPEAQEIIFGMPINESVILTGHVRAQVRLFMLLNGGGEEQEPGKPEESGDLSKKENPQLVTPSPASTGSSLTTGSPSMRPSGNFPSQQPSPSSPRRQKDEAETLGQTTPSAQGSMPATAPETS